jgi:hypothetical protein
MRELPVPAPPGDRAVGQLIAETIRCYGDHFWRALPLGLPLAIASAVISGHAINAQVAILCAFAPLFSAAYVYASLLALDLRSVSRRRMLFATVLGILIWLPAPVLLRAYVLPMFLWLAFFGLAVPAALAERLGPRAAIARGRRLASADFVHALGALCGLLIVVILSAGVLSALLHGQGESTRRAASFLALLVLSPLLYLGPALLYTDQEARIGVRRPRRGRRRRAGLDADAAGPTEP